MKHLKIKTKARNDFVDVTAVVAQEVTSSGIEQGICTLFVPHTTAGITINENTDPNVVQDMQHVLDEVVPWDKGYHHAEGNSAAHVKASLMGFSVQVPIEKGKLLLGTWQGIYFCEFDGPRIREIWIQLFAG